jgi:hypothetical protein
MPEPSLPIWASPGGDHRAAMRSPALGARTARVRFEVRFPPYTIAAGPAVDANGQIWLAVGGKKEKPTLVVLSPRGERVREVPLEGWEQELGDDSHSDQAAPHLVLVPGGLWLAGRRMLERRDTRGDVLHQRLLGRGRRLAFGATPDGDLLVWQQPASLGTELVRHAADGAIRWSVPTPQGGYVYRREMACDDRGTTYLSAAARMGDGVSGDDLPTGGLAIVSPAGVLVPVPTVSFPRWGYGDLCAAQAASVVIGVTPQVEIDAGGRLLRERHPRGDDPATVPWDGFRMRVTARSQVLDPSLLLSFYESATQMYRPTVDAAGVRYVVLERSGHYDDLPTDPAALVALDPEDRCLFRLETAKIGVSVGTTLAVGPEGTLLVVHRDGLTALG